MSTLAFLTYVSRSGSTLLARLLDEYDDIAVTLESQYPDGVTNRPPLDIDTPQALPAAMDRLYSDPKFREWNVDRDELTRRLKQEAFPLPAERVLEVILERTFADQSPSAVVVKAGDYIQNLREVRNRYPRAKVIFVMRDPRAILNSQRNATASLHGGVMNRNPVITARAFNNCVRAIEAHRSADWLGVFQYEALICRPEETLQRVRAFLGLGEAARQGGQYARRIPDAQKHLHANVDRPPDAARLNAWQNELDPADVDVLQRLAGPAMQRWGYAPIDIQPGGQRVRGLVRLLGGLVGFALWRIRRLLGAKP
jgi:hypothetical protein